MSDDRITPTSPPPSIRPHASEIGAAVLDDAMRQTGSHRAQVQANTHFEDSINKLTIAIRYYAKTQFLIFGLLAIVIGVMAWRMWAYSDQAAARYQINDRHWQALDQRLDRLEHVEP